MAEHELIGKVITLMRQDDRIFFGRDHSIPAGDVSGYTSDTLFRVTDFDEQRRVLHLKPDGHAPQSSYLYTFARYGDHLAALDITRIEISHRRGLLGALQTRNDMPVQHPPVSYPPVTYQPEVQPAPRPSPTLGYKFTDTLSFDIRDAVFDEGTITFEVKVKTAWQNVQVTIQNPTIRKYFDSVKNYIWKLFGSKKTPCTITFDMQQGKCIPVSVDDCVLLNLNGDILQNIQESWVQEFVLDNDNEEIVTLSDLTHALQDETMTDEGVFNQLVKESKTKHHHHLQYLSKRQAIELQKLSITGKPLSFVFVIRVNGTLYLVWETYLTQEATYIWKLPSADSILKKYALILQLRKSNKMAYRRKKEEDFCLIEHQYQLPLNGFLKWKEDLEDFVK